MRSKAAPVALTAGVLALGVALPACGSASPPVAVTSTAPVTAQPATASPRPVASPSPRITPAPTKIPGPTRPTVHLGTPAPHPTIATARATCKLRSGIQVIAGRSAIVTLPPALPAPVVIDFHGGSQSAAQEYAYTGLARAGQLNDYIVVTPNGTNGLWNFTGNEPGLPDDIGFVRAIDAGLALAGCSNGKVYTAGISDGADMAVAAACRIPEVRAVFAVAPSITPRQPCLRKPYLEVHGTADPVVPYAGSASGSFADVPSEPVAARLAYWTSGCSGPVSGPARAAGTATQQWSCPGGRTVELDTVGGGGHTWPGAPGNEPAAGLGARAPWSAAVAALSFFGAH
jgi:polyhydroxybutyrate depolymerase